MPHCNSLPIEFKDKLNLNGQWSFRQSGTQQWLLANVPGCNFLDLMLNGLIPDGFESDNEGALQWIENCNWEYKLDFELESGWFAALELELCFDGLDTYCEVYLNGQLLMTGQNMFVRHVQPCKDALRPGTNELLLVFESPINRTLPLYQNNGFVYPAENDKSEEKLSVYTRKAPCHFGWDWGPRFVTSGIWRDVYLKARHQACIRDVHCEQLEVNQQRASLMFNIELAYFSGFKGKVNISCVEDPTLTTEVNISEFSDHLVTTSVIIDNPRLWWPNGLGEAFLYHWNIELVVENQLVDCHSLTSGLRTIEVITEKDADGESFLFRVNGEPVFMKGANYIPSDSFLPRVDKKKYRRVMEDAVNANMNMLRVWGGGIYEDDYFYQLADENGILIWQDFMFACSLYPADQAFLQNVTEEAIDNIKRLRNFACIALWCGNNEVEMGIETWQWPEKFDYSDTLYDQLKQDYHTLFRQLLPSLVAVHGSGVEYLSSSPSGFWEFPEQDGFGNHHFWGVWHGEQPFSELKKRVPRFMTEYGFQSFPLQASVDKYIPVSEQHLDSVAMTVHQKHPRGNQLIRRYLSDEHQTSQDFRSFLYLSQVQQADGIKMGIDAHRQARPFCMGTLYWQFNDCWPAASWSGIDYYGCWKALHYEVRRSYAMMNLIFSQTDDELTVSFVSDHLEAVELDLDLRLMTLAGEEIWAKKKQYRLAKSSSQKMEVFNLPSLLGKQDGADVVMVATYEDTQQHVHQRTHYLVPSKALKLPRTSVSFASSVNNGQLDLIVTAHTFVRHLYVWIDDIHGNFSDNFFDMLPGQKRLITLDLNGQSLAANNLATDICYLSVGDSYQHASEKES